MKFSKFIDTLLGQILLASVFCITISLIFNKPIGYTIGTSYAIFVGLPFLKNPTNKRAYKIICIFSIFIIGLGALFLSSAAINNYTRFLFIWGSFIIISYIIPLFKELKVQKSAKGAQ